MNDDTTLTLDQRLAAQQAEYDTQTARAISDGHTPSGEHLLREAEDRAVERRRMKEDDFHEHPDEWEFVNVWLESDYDRAAIDAMQIEGYHYVEAHVTDIDSGEHGVALYRKAAQS